jgi:hypothetical protein
MKSGQRWVQHPLWGRPNQRRTTLARRGGKVLPGLQVAGRETTITRTGLRSITLRPDLLSAAVAAMAGVLSRGRHAWPRIFDGVRRS